MRTLPTTDEGVRQRMQHLEGHLQRMKAHSAVQCEIAAGSGKLWWRGFNAAIVDALQELERFDAAREDE